MSLTLRQVAAQAQERGERLPPSTLSRIEAGKLDPGVRRLNVLLRVYDLEPDYVSDLVELESLAVARPTGDLKGLLARGVEFWKRGDIPQALGHALAVMEATPADEASRIQRQGATITFAAYASDLGKLKLARRLIDGILCEPPHPSLLIDTLLIAAAIWCELGAMAAALGLAREAVRRLAPGDDASAARAHHQLAKLLLNGGWPEEASEVLDRAFEHYEKVNDPQNLSKARILRIRVLDKQGRIEDAIALARKSIEIAEAEDRGRSKLHTRLELGRLLTATGHLDEAIDELRRSLAEATLIQDRRAEFDAHARLWKVFEKAGDARGARIELDQARTLIHLVEDNSDEAVQVRAASTKRELRR